MKCGDPAADEGKRKPREGGGKGHGSKWVRKKAEAIAALLSQPNVEEAARVAGISAQTLYRGMKMPEFEAAYSEARQALRSRKINFTDWAQWCSSIAVVLCWA